MALAAVVLLYLAAALVGSLVPVNRNWTEPAKGTTVYLASNGVHVDLVMPVRAQGLDWSRLLPRREFAAAPADLRWIAFGSGEQRVYLDTPTWWDLRPRTIWSALTGGKRVMHVQYVASPEYADRAIRLRPEEYRRLWAAVRADFALGADGKPQHIDHPGYGPTDAFYRASGKQSVLRTCNSSLADWLRLAGIKTSLWPPFARGVTWRYRQTATGRSG